MAVVIGLCLVISYLMPRLTRLDVYFAVRVPPEFRDSVEGCSILKRYRTKKFETSATARLLVATKKTLSVSSVPLQALTQSTRSPVPDGAGRSISVTSVLRPF
jgi:hypothetical protein